MLLVPVKRWKGYILTVHEKSCQTALAHNWHSYHSGCDLSVRPCISVCISAVIKRMEVLHPGTAGLIITAGANIFPEGVKADFWAEFSKELLKDSIPPLTRMMLLEPQMTAEDMQTIQCPALITIGEFDLIDESHTRMIAENIPQGQMLIVPNEDHGSFVYKSPKIGEIILQYLTEQGY